MKNKKETIDLIHLGDLVQFKGRGGSSNLRSNVWRLVDIDIVKVGEKYQTLCHLELVKGHITLNVKQEGVGFRRSYWLKNLKKKEE